MKYTIVQYRDGNRLCGTIYFGIINAEQAKAKFRAEFPEHADEDLITRVYNSED